MGNSNNNVFLMKQYIYHLKRDYFGQDAEKRETTLGRMIREDGSLFGYVLEDVVRAFGIKVKKTTAIPATVGDDTYKLSVMDSPKYGRVVTVLTDLIDGIPLLEYGGVLFEYIRCHGGNNADHTEGCLLMNKNRDVKKFSAWGSLKDEFAKEVSDLEKQGFDVRLRVSNAH